MEWQELPVDIQLRALRFVPRDDLLVAMRVCRRWAGLIAAPSSELWEPVVPGLPGLLPDGVGLASPVAYVLWRRWEQSRSDARARKLEGAGRAKRARREYAAVEARRASHGAGIDGWFALSPWRGAAVAWLPADVLFEVPPSPSSRHLRATRRNRAPDSDRTIRTAFFQRRCRNDDDAFRFRDFDSSSVEEMLSATKRRSGALLDIVLLPLGIVNDAGPVAGLGAEWGKGRDATTWRQLVLATKVLECYFASSATGTGCRAELRMAEAAQIREGTLCNMWSDPGGLGYRDDPNDPLVTQVNAEEIGYQLTRQLSGTAPGPEPLRDESIVRLVVVHPHMYPDNAGRYAWVYSTSIMAGDKADDKWDEVCALSTYQDFNVYGTAAAGDEAIVRHVLHTAFDMLFGLRNCENTACVLNNCDSVSEAEASEAIVTLCPVCLRAVQLQGAFDDGLDVLRKLAAVLGSEMFRKSRRVAAERARLCAWIRASAPSERAELAPTSVGTTA